LGLGRRFDPNSSRLASTAASSRPYDFDKKKPLFRTVANNAVDDVVSVHKRVQSLTKLLHRNSLFDLEISISSMQSTLFTMVFRGANSGGPLIFVRATQGEHASDDLNLCISLHRPEVIVKRLPRCSCCVVFKGKV